MGIGWYGKTCRRRNIFRLCIGKRASEPPSMPEYVVFWKYLDWTIMTCVWFLVILIIMNYHYHHHHHHHHNYNFYHSYLVYLTCSKMYFLHPNFALQRKGLTCSNWDDVIWAMPERKRFVFPELVSWITLDLLHSAPAIHQYIKLEFKLHCPRSRLLQVLLGLLDFGCPMSKSYVLVY